MRFHDYSILELALVVRDAKANPNAYDREARDALRKACQSSIRQQTPEGFLSRFEAVSDRALGQTAYSEVSSYAKPAGYTSGVWA